MPPKPKSGFNKRLGLGPKPAKPCPTCYRPMRLISERSKLYACEKHGVPTRP